MFYLNGLTASYIDCHERLQPTTAKSMASTDSKTLNQVAAFLRSSNNLPIQECVMADKRVDIFKGSLAVKALLSSSYARLGKVPKVTSTEEAHALLTEMIDEGLFIRARQVSNSRVFQPEISRQFEEDGLYAWIYEGSKLGGYLLSAAFLVGLLTIMMFPLWPMSIRSKASLLINWAMYAVLAIIGFLIALSIVRMIIYVITRIFMKRGFWIFPNLWEDCGVLESFLPFYNWEDEWVPPGKAAPKNTSAVSVASANAK